MVNIDHKVGLTTNNCLRINGLKIVPGKPRYSEKTAFRPKTDQGRATLQAPGLLHFRHLQRPHDAAPCHLQLWSL